MVYSLLFMEDSDEIIGTAASQSVGGSQGTALRYQTENQKPKTENWLLNTDN